MVNIVDKLAAPAATTQETQTGLDIFLNNLYFTTSLAGSIVLITFIVPRLKTWSAQVALATGLTINMLGVVCVRGSQWLRLADPQLPANMSDWLDYLGANAFGTFLGTLGLLIALHPLLKAIWSVSWVWGMLPVFAIAVLMTLTITGIPYL